MLVFEGARRPIDALAFHPDGVRVAAAGGKFFWTTFWDATTGARLAEWPATSPGIPHNIAFHPAGDCLYCASGGPRGLIVVDIRTGTWVDDESRDASPHPAYGVAIDPAGTRLLLDGGHDRITAFRAAILEPEWELAAEGGWRFQRQAFFPDGERFLSVEYRDAEQGPDETRICIRSSADGSLLTQLGTARGTPWQAEVSPDGEWAAVRAGSGLFLFRTNGPGEPVQPAGPNKKHPTAIAFHPAGRFLAVTSNDRTVRIHDRDAGWAITKTFDWDIGKLKSVAFSPNGSLAAAGGDIGKVVVWDFDC